MGIVTVAEKQRVLSHQDERTDEGGGHQGGLCPQDLQTGGQAELGKEEEARVDGNNRPDSLCERAHRRKSRDGTRGGEKGRGSSRRSLPRDEGGSTGTRPSQGEHRAQEATSDVGWQEKERCDEGWWIHGLLRKNCLITSTFHIFPLKPIFYHCNKNRSYFKCTRFILLLTE